MMKSTMLTLLLGMGTLFVSAQTAEELSEKYLTALGGKEKIKSLKSLEQDATMSIMGMDLTGTTKIVYGEGSRQEIDVQGQKIITYIGKDKGWTINPMMGSVEPQELPQDALKGASNILAFGGDLANYKAIGLTATTEGTEDINGKKAHKIKLTKEGYENTLYLDASSYYLVRSITKVVAEGQEIVQTTDFSDYKAADNGVVVPYTTVISNPAMGELKAVSSKVAFNTGITDADLQKVN